MTDTRNKIDITEELKNAVLELVGSFLREARSMCSSDEEFYRVIDWLISRDKK